MNKIIYCVVFSIVCLSCSHPAKKVKVEVQNNGVHIDYTDSGAGDTTLLFVHGWCINKSYWSNQVAYFSKRYRVVTIDLPGFGESGKNRKSFTTLTFAADVDTVISQLHLNKVILIGHSMSGDIVLQAAIDAHKKVIGFVGIDNFKNVGIVQGDTAKQRAGYNEAINTLKHHFKKMAFEYINQSLFYKTTSDSIKTRVLNDVANADTTIAATCLEQNNFYEADKLKQAKKKLYLINSDVYPTDTTGLIAKKLPYKILYIRTTGHFPMIEKPKEFNIALQQVIREMKKDK